MCQNWISFKFFSYCKIKGLIFTTQVNWREFDYSNIMTMVKERQVFVTAYTVKVLGAKLILCKAVLMWGNPQKWLLWIPARITLLQVTVLKVAYKNMESNLWQQFVIQWIRNLFEIEMEEGGCVISKCWAADFAFHDKELTPVLQQPVLAQNCPCGVLRAAELSGQVWEWAASCPATDGWYPGPSAATGRKMVFNSRRLEKG